jgi:hypothetical protein
MDLISCHCTIPRFTHPRHTLRKFWATIKKVIPILAFLAAFFVLFGGWLTADRMGGNFLEERAFGSELVNEFDSGNAGLDIWGLLAVGLVVVHAEILQVWCLRRGYLALSVEDMHGLGAVVQSVPLRVRHVTPHHLLTLIAIISITNRLID